jgi:uncharacterized repeat protein (TIGR03803 family)
MRIARVLALCLLPSLAAAQTTVNQPVQVLHRFTPSPANPNGPLVQVPDGSFYGVTLTGIIRLATNGQVTQVATFAHSAPVGALVHATDGGLYGATVSRITYGGPEGTIFRFDPATNELRTIHTFSAPGDGRGPVGGLVAVGGSLYGVTRYGPGSSDTAGTIFHVVVATGEFVVDHVFTSGSPTPFATPNSPLTLGLDGFLYGTTAIGPLGNLYRFDPVTRAMTSLRQFSEAEGVNPGELVLGADGSLYGSSSRGGTEASGTIFRYTPSTGIFQRLHSLTPSNGFDGRGPGPLVAGGDGHFYGITDAPNQGSGFPPAAGTLFRLRAGGGTFTYETIRVLDRNVDGFPAQARLTLGADGLLYGFAQTKGPTLAGTDAGAVIGGPTGPAGTGTLFRFDPAEPGPPSNPTAFTVLHAFPLLTRWEPSTLVAATDGFLYGTLSAGGPTNRGATYRLNPATAAVTILADLPGALIGYADNSALIQGNDGLLYGTAQPSIVRIDPATGAGTVAAPSQGIEGLARTPNGTMFGVQRVGQPQLFHFNAATNILLTIAQLNGVNFVTPVSTTSDGQTFVVAQRAVVVGGGVTQFQRTWLMWPAASPTGVNTVAELLLGDDLLSIDRLVEGAGGVLYLAATYGVLGPSILSVDRTTGALARVCGLTTNAGTTFEHLSQGPGGSLYGFVNGSGPQRLFRCDPSTGALTVSPLPLDLGRVVGPLTNVGGVLYGAATGIVPSQGGVLFRFAPGATLPAVDTDGDTLPNVWETAYGLDPFGTGSGNGAGDDPDGDGRTNAQELADGTHPRGFFTRLFAEGATNAFFRTRFDLTSPSPLGAAVRARFLTDTGVVVATDLLVRPQSHLEFDPATLPGLANATFSTIIESDDEVAVDRTMTWGAGGYGSHLETGLAAPSTTWFFAEGSTSGEFALFYLLQNPQATAVTATVTYLRPFGQPTIVRTYNLPPNSRTTIVVDDQTAELASTDVSASITATAPIVAERAMYLSKPGQAFAAGHESAGVKAPALDWFLAEGATGAFFDLFVLIANPGSTAATVEVEYLRTSGGPLTKTYTVPAQSRMTIWVDDEELPAGSGQKPLANGSVSTTVRSTNAVPIIVERAMWWPGPAVASNFWYEAHNSPGATGTATRWVLGGAEIGGPDEADTYVLIANTTSTPGRALVRILADDASAMDKTVELPAKSRTTVSLRPTSIAARPINGRVGVVVESLGENPVPIVVERATYASPGGTFWGSGGNALASPVP